MSEPKSVLEEIGIEVPALIAVKVHKDTVTVKNFAIPIESADEDETMASNPLFRKAIALLPRHQHQSKKSLVLQKIGSL